MSDGKHYVPHGYAVEWSKASDGLHFRTVARQLRIKPNEAGEWRWRDVEKITARIADEKSIRRKYHKNVWRGER